MSEQEQGPTAAVDPSPSDRPSVIGQAMRSGRSRIHDARLERRTSDRLYLVALSDGEQLFDCPIAQARLEPALGSAPRRVRLPGGHLFLTRDPAIADLLGEPAGQQGIGRFETSRRWLVVAVGMIFLAGWLLWSQGVPVAARAAARVTPVSWMSLMDDSSLQVLGVTMKIRAHSDEIRQAKTQDILDRLSAKLETQREFKLLIADVHLPNAFALPGGTVVVTQGLLYEVWPENGTGSDDVMAGVLAHEIGHVVERHGLENLYSSSAVYLLMSLIFGDAGMLFEHVLVNGQALLELAYSRDHERSADDFGLALSRQAGYDPEGLIGFLERIQAMEEAEGFAMPAWASTHPNTQKRIRRLREQLQE